MTVTRTCLDRRAVALSEDRGGTYGVNKDGGVVRIEDKENGRKKEANEGERTTEKGSQGEEIAERRGEGSEKVLKNGEVSIEGRCSWKAVRQRQSRVGWGGSQVKRRGTTAGMLVDASAPIRGTLQQQECSSRSSAPTKPWGTRGGMPLDAVRCGGNCGRNYQRETRSRKRVPLDRRCGPPVDDQWQGRSSGRPRKGGRRAASPRSRPRPRMMRAAEC